MISGRFFLVPFALCATSLGKGSFGSLAIGCLRWGNANNEPQQWGCNANMARKMSFLLQQFQLEKVNFSASIAGIGNA